MRKDVCYKGMPVTFEFTGYTFQGKVTKTNKARAKVEINANIGKYKKGSTFDVPYSLLNAVKAEDKRREAEPPKYDHIKVGEITLVDGEKEHRTDNGKNRKDHYFNGTVVINDRPLAFELHLINDPHFDTQNPTKWRATIEVNSDSKERINDCIECCGNRGRSGPHTSGDTALVLGQKILPLIEAKGYELVKEKTSYTPGGWWLFTMRLDEAGEADYKPSRRRFYVEHHRQVCCPVHGKRKQVEVEPAF